MLNAGRQLGGAIGVALLGTIIAGSGPTGSSLRIALAVSAVAFALGCGVALATMRPRTRTP